MFSFFRHILEKKSSITWFGNRHYHKKVTPNKMNPNHYPRKRTQIITQEKKKKQNKKSTKSRILKKKRTLENETQMYKLLVYHKVPIIYQPPYCSNSFQKQMNQRMWWIKNHSIFCRLMKNTTITKY